MGDGKGIVRVLDAVTGDESAVFRHDGKPLIQIVRWSADGRLVLSGDSDGRFIVWDMASRKQRSQFRWKYIIDESYEACFANDGHSIVVEGPSGELGVRAVTTGEPVTLEDVHRRTMDAVKMRTRQMWTCAFERGDPELSIRQSGRDEVVARLPIPYGDILNHPTGRIWGVRRSGHFYLFQLENS
jgi:WD40 repeat protein